MNKVFISGNTTKDIELKTAPTGVSFCHFTLAVTGWKNKDGERRTDFIDCTAFNKTAERLVKYVKKGDKIYVIGELQKNDYTASDGTKRYTTKVIINEVEFMGGKKESSNNAPANTRADWNDVDDDDIPF